MFSQTIWHYLWLGFGLIWLVACLPLSKNNEVLPTPNPTAPFPVLPTATTPLLPTVTTIPETELSDTNGQISTSTPSPLPTTVSTTEPTPTLAPAATYTVQSGDNLQYIASNFGVTLLDLKTFNNLETDFIRDGDILLIPPPAYSTEPESRLIPYAVKAGDSFYTIAIRYGISEANLQSANPAITPESLIIGSTIYIPLDVHIVAEGDTLSEIAASNDVNFDSLVQANVHVLNLDNLHFINVGDELLLPGNDEGLVIGVNCSPLPNPGRVTDYTIGFNEGLFCLVSKFSLTPATLLNANPHIIGDNALREGITIQVPPTEGALYTLTEPDITNETTLADIAQWYNVQNIDAIVDWDGNPIPLPLAEGQTLFLPNADTLAEPYGTIQPLIVINDDDPIIPPPSDDTGNGDDGTTDAPPPPAPIGAPFSGLSARLWTDPYSIQSAGYCPWTIGSGWTGSFVWPTTNREIQRPYEPGHSGIDIPLPENTPVYAAESGIVVWAGYTIFGGGFRVILAHGNQWRTVYAHLNSASVNCGQFISKGTVVGLSGQTGTYYPHLHFAVRNESVTSDPCLFMACPES